MVPFITAELFLEQLVLIGALSMLVLAVLWPHAKPLLLQFFNKFLSPISDTFYENANKAEQITDKSRGKNRRPINDHPRLSGRSLRRTATDKEVRINLILITCSLS